LSYFKNRHDSIATVMFAFFYLRQYFTKIWWRQKRK